MANIGALMLGRAKQTIQRSVIRYFGTSVKRGDKFFFDERGAIHIPEGQKSVADAGGGYTPADPLALYRPTSSKFVNAEKAMESNFGWVYTLVKAISDEMAGIEFRLYRIKNMKGETEEVLKDELLDLLDGVNDRQTGPEFKKTLGAHLELTGNAYIYLYGVKDFSSKPTAMYLLNPGQTKVLLNKTVYPYTVAGYEMRDNERVFKFQPHEIVHLKYPDPNDQYDGQGTPQGIAEWIDNDNYAMEFNRNFFRNGARLNGIFETEFTSFEQVQRLKILFDEQFAGVKNAYKTMIVPKGVKWVPNQASFKDMDFSQGLDKTASRIQAGFRVSRTILGVAESETNRATAETADYVFAKRVIKPKIEMIVSFLNEFLVPRFGQDIFLWYKDPTPIDSAAQSVEIRTVTGGKAIMTQNEARERYLGLPRIEDENADKLSSAAGDLGQMFGASGASAGSVVDPRVVRYSRSYTNRKAGIKTQFYRNMKTRQDIAAAIAKAATEILSKNEKLVKSAKKKDIKDLTDDEYVAVYFGDQKARRDEYQPQFREVMRAFSAKQQKEVLKNLDRAIKTYILTDKKDIVPSKLFDMDEWINILVDAVTPVARRMFKEEGFSALRNIGATQIDLLDDPAIEKALDKRMKLLARSYNDTLINMLETRLNEGLAAGSSLPELKNTVQDIYVWSHDYQAERVAKTETVAISNDANKQAWKKAGTVSEVKWITSGKDNVCPFCSAMNGKTIQIDENFFDKGEKLTVDGEVLNLDYSAVGGPPLHPNCGCLMRPSAFNPLRL